MTIPLQNILPNVDSIYYNKRLICQGPSADRTRTGVTTINLLHKLTMPNNGFSNFIRPTTQKPQFVNTPKITTSTRKPVYTQSTTQRTYRTVPSTQVYSRNPPKTERPSTQSSTRRSTTEHYIEQYTDSKPQQCGRAISGISLIKGGKKIKRGQWVLNFF